MALSSAAQETAVVRTNATARIVAEAVRDVGVAPWLKLLKEGCKLDWL